MGQFPEKPQIWQKGQSGNPKGRAKGVKTLKTRLHELMSTDVEYLGLDEVRRTMRVDDAMGIALVAKALGGDIKAIEMINKELGDNDSNAMPLTATQNLIVQRAMLRALPDFEKLKDITPS